MSRSTKGAPMQTRGRCGKCGEPRCRTHCKCGRRGTAQGRSAPRPPRNASASTGASASNTPIRPRVTLPEVAAVGAVVRRPAPVSVEVFTESALWIDAIIKEMGAASAMCVASYIADDERFCNAVLTRLQGRRPYTCQVVVDDATFRAGASRHQRARRRQLHLKKGASVQLGRGKLKMKSLLHLTPVYATGTPAAKLGARAHAHSALAARRAALAPLAQFQYSDLSTLKQLITLSLWQLAGDSSSSFFRLLCRPLLRERPIGAYRNLVQTLPQIYLGCPRDRFELGYTVRRCVLGFEMVTKRT